MKYIGIQQNPGKMLWFNPDAVAYVEESSPGSCDVHLTSGQAVRVTGVPANHACLMLSRNE